MPAAAATKKILLGAVVISPYEMHPLKIATAVSTLNEYANGRGMVVIGGGGEWPGVLGVKYGKRVTGCGEAVAMVKRAVAGQVVKWDGAGLQGPLLPRRLGQGHAADHLRRRHRPEDDGHGHALRGRHHAERHDPADARRGPWATFARGSQSTAAIRPASG